MELRQLRYLVALADEHHFTRAAAREHVAQPALSQQILRLEAELGLALVQRTTRRVALTEAGELMVARARRVLAEVASAQAEVAGLRGLRTGQVTVGAMHTMGPVDLSALLADFRDAYPGVELSVREQASEELAEMLRADELDLAFLSVTERIGSHGLSLHRLVEEELVVVLPLHHELAQRSEGLALAALAQDTFISFREGSRLRELLVSAGHSVGFQPHVALESNDARRICSLVSRGLGVAILPRSDAQDAGGAVAVAELCQPPLSRDITLAWRADRRQSPACEAFLARVTHSGDR